MAELSSKGLIPQLTDVLRALTESQALLVAKLHDVQLVQQGPADSAPPPSGQPFDAFDGGTAPPVEHTERPSDLVPGTTESPRRPEFLSATELVKPASSDVRREPPVTQVHAPFSGPQDAPARNATSDESPSVHPKFESDSSPSYNFFDELDAQLAEVDKPRNATEL